MFNVNIKPVLFIMLLMLSGYASYAMEASTAYQSIEYYGERFSRLIAYGRYEDGLKLAQEAIKLFPQSALINNYQGLFFYYLSEYDKARTSFHKALEIDPNYLKAQKNLEQLEWYVMRLQ